MSHISKTTGRLLQRQGRHQGSRKELQDGQKPRWSDDLTRYLCPIMARDKKWLRSISYGFLQRDWIWIGLRVLTLFCENSWRNTILILYLILYNMGLLSGIMGFALLGILFVRTWFVYTFIGDIKLNSEKHVL